MRTRATRHPPPRLGRRGVGCVPGKLRNLHTAFALYH